MFYQKVIMTPFVVSILFCLLFLGEAAKPTDSPTVESKLGHTDLRHKLMKDLMEDYDNRVIPVRNKSESMHVAFEMSLNQIVELEEKTQIMRLVVWTRLYWRDEFLTWNKEDYDGVDKLFLSVDEIWRPDIVLYNSVDVERTAFEVFPSGVAGVTSDGEVSWFAPVIMQSLCRIKVELYPFDIQDCPLKFGSWSYDGTKINLTNKEPKIALGNYVPSVEWEVIDTPCKRNVFYYECCPEPYPDVTCRLVMRRRPAFYLFNLVLPTVLLIIIGLLVFCLPPESGEKVSLAITVLLAMTVFMLIVMENVPPNSEAIPLLEQFIGGTIGMLTLSTAMAVFVVNFAFRGSYCRPPRWMRVLCFKALAPVCCLKKEVQGLDEVEDKDSATSYTIKNNGVSLVSVSSGHLNGPNRVTSASDVKVRTMETDLSSNASTNETLRDILMEMREQNNRIRERYRDKKQDGVCEMEWRIVAMVLDRLFFIVLLIITVIMGLAVFSPMF